MNTHFRRAGLALLALVLATNIQTTARAELPTVSGDLETAIRVYRERRSTAKPETVLAWLREGNRRFPAGLSIHCGILPALFVY